ncbi:hypothetical protein LZ30DRAFT_393302 [Colletotrichum cereale]|nr:hypothetical protein LZ30DRAFT_393302 [Colletotrichum cereale]
MLGLQSTETQVESGSFPATVLYPQSHHTYILTFNCRPKCAQCGINNVPCQWPQQRKRGPPKDYIMTMEKRLMETESVLCALMAQVSDDQLSSAFSLDQSDCQSGGSGVAQSDSNALDSIKAHHFGPVYWGTYPLKSVQGVKRWFKDRASISTNLAKTQRPRSVQVDLEEYEATASGTDENHENDFEETEDNAGTFDIGVIGPKSEDSESYESAFLW